MLKQYEIHSNYCDKKNMVQAKQRIWQKVKFGKVVFPAKFWDSNTKELKGGSTLWIVGKVIELDNRRYTLTKTKGTVLEISPEDGLYNYIDENRKIFLSCNECYVFMDYDVSVAVVKTFAEYGDKSHLNLQKINTSLCDKTFLFYKEDVRKIKIRLAEIESEKLKEKILGKTNAQEIEKIKCFIKDYKKLEVLEDDNARIEQNIFIKKNEGLKLVFTRKVVDIFPKNEILKENINAGNFIALSFHDIMQNASSQSNFYYHTETDIVKWFNKRKRCYSFKLYSHDAGGKTEDILLLDFLLRIKKGKSNYEYYINNIRMPKKKVSKAFGDFYPHGWRQRIGEYNNFLRDVKRYSETQLGLLKGISGKMNFAEHKVPYRIGITNPKANEWEITFGDLSWRITYAKLNDLRYSLQCYSGDVYGLIEAISKLARKSEKTEDYVLSVLRQNLNAVVQAEEKAKKLWDEIEGKYPDRIFRQNGKYIVKGRFRTYQLTLNNDDVKVETYPDGRYVCINAKTKQGADYPGYDKLIQYTLALLNDSDTQNQISTLR